MLAEHGTAFVFSVLAMAAAFFAAIYLPVPVMRQFCLQVVLSLHYSRTSCHGNCYYATLDPFALP